MISTRAAILTLLASMPAWANGPYDCYKAVFGVSVKEGAEIGTFLYTPKMTLRESKIKFLQTSLRDSVLRMPGANGYSEQQKIIAELDQITVQLRDIRALPNIKHNYIVSNSGVLAQKSGTERFKDGTIKISPAGEMSGVERMHVTEDLTVLLTKKLKSKLIGWTKQYGARRWERDSQRISKACMYLIENDAELSTKLKFLARLMGNPAPANVTPHYSAEETPTAKPASAPPSAPTSHGLKNQK